MGPPPMAPASIPAGFPYIAGCRECRDCTMACSAVCPAAVDGARRWTGWPSWWAWPACRGAGGNTLNPNGCRRALAAASHSPPTGAMRGKPASSHWSARCSCFLAGNVRSSTADKRGCLLDGGNVQPKVPLQLFLKPTGRSDPQPKALGGRAVGLVGQFTNRSKKI